MTASWAPGFPKEYVCADDERERKNERMVADMVRSCVIQ